MWCKQCRQDVPGLGLPLEGGYCCPRCGGKFPPHSAHAVCGSAANSGEPASESAFDSTAASSAAATPSAYDDWELDDQLRHIERVLIAGRERSGRREAVYRREAARLEPPQAAIPPWHVPTPAKPARRQARARGEGNYFLATLTWVALMLGTMSFVCGGVLLGWSLLTGRQELWTLGLPVALCGQIALLVGLLLQLDRLWLDSRSAAAKLDVVDEQLHELKTTTTLLGTSHGSPAAFYSHLADGAGPRVLLSDLKSQLDLLALKLSMNDEY